MESFELAAHGLQHADQKDLVKQMHGLFSAITKMDADQTVAAYQTLNLIEEMSPNDQAKVMARHFKTAVSAHMKHLIRQIRGSSKLGERGDLASRFSKVAGEHISLL